MAVVAILLLAGVAAAGLLLVVFVVLWGGRVRRAVRAPLRASRPRDEFWYLRPQKRLPAREDERDDGPRTEQEDGPGGEQGRE